MLPSDVRMLTGARQTLAELADNLPPSERAKIAALDSVMVELLLRRDNAFYENHFAEGLALAREGISCFQPAVASATLNQNLERLQKVDSVGPESLPPLCDLLQTIVVSLTTPEADKLDTARQFLDDVVTWETSFHQRHHQHPMSTIAAKEYLNPDRLLAYLQNRLPEKLPSTVENLKVLTGGFSKRTVLFDIIYDDGTVESLVIRAEQPPRFGFWDGDQVRNEFPLLQLVFEAGHTVPEPLWLEEDTSLLGQPFLVSRMAQGYNLGTSAGNRVTISHEALTDIVRHLVKIHNTVVDPEDPRITASHLQAWARIENLEDCVTAWVDHWIEKVKTKGLRASPLTARTLRWLRNNVPACRERPRLLHGDFGVHNLLVDGDRVTAILDWEYLMFGDPAEDLALLHLTLGGAVEKSEIVRLYHELGGMEIDEYRLRYFDVMYAIKFVIPPENALHLYEHDPGADFKLCQFGFQYTYVGASTINDKIALAEKARLAP